MSVFDIDDVIDLNQAFDNQSINLNSIDDNEWKLLCSQLVTPASSVCNDRPESSCESVLLFKNINNDDEHSYIDLEANDLIEFLDTQSILAEDYFISPRPTSNSKILQDLKKTMIYNRAQSILARRRLGKSLLKSITPKSLVVHVPPPPTPERTRYNHPASVTSVTQSARQLLETIEERRKNSMVIDGRLHISYNKEPTAQPKSSSQSKHREKYVLKKSDPSAREQRPENEYRGLLLSRLPQPVSYRLLSK